MKTANQHGVFEEETVEVVAQSGEAPATVSICQCDDKLYRYSTAVEYGIGGFCGPITLQSEGLATQTAARNAGIEELARRWPVGQPSDPEGGPSRFGGPAAGFARGNQPSFAVRFGHVIT